MTDARLDLQRRQRLGMVEAVWGEHKTADQILNVLRGFEAVGEVGFVTRVDAEKARVVTSTLTSAEYHPLARCLTLGSCPSAGNTADVAVLSGGSSDAAVVAEIGLALRWHGIGVESFMDVGVAGLHRLLAVLPELENVKVLIACAGMEGALPTVLTGLVRQPVIGVPVSVGYGISAGGRTALEGMLASCAPGLTVVNIDNGYGAAMAALRIIGSQAL